MTDVSNPGDAPINEDKCDLEPSEWPEIPSYGDEVNEIWYEDNRYGWRGSDSHGEFSLDTGSPYPLLEDDVDYIPCNAVVKYTFERYGEKRYCTQAAQTNFEGDTIPEGEAASTCRLHKVQQNFTDIHMDNIKSGAFAKSYEHVFQYLPPHKKVLAIAFLDDLFSESIYDFDQDAVEYTIDTTDAGWIEQEETEVEFPVPTEHVTRGQSLWYAAVMFVQMQDIKEEQFRVAAEETYEGRPLAIGETTTYISGENGPVEVVDEHHLNLPLSRIMKDYDEHLKFGGVEVDDEEETSVKPTEYVLEMDIPDPHTAAGQNLTPIAEDVQREQREEHQ